MFSPGFIGLAVLLYVGGLLLVAFWGERSGRGAKKHRGQAYIYALSMTVYCTSWTYYGSVGKAATTGPLFLAIYLGPTLGLLFAWIVIRKIIRAKNLCHVTSIADFLSSRYSKSQGIAALATVIVLVGTMPYVALQLKAVTTTFHLVTGADLEQASWLSRNIGPVIVLVMLAFTILFGVRRLDPTERHQGMILALSVECCIKLLAFLAAGIYVTFFLFDGFGDLVGRAMQNGGPAQNVLEYSPPFSTWATFMVLAMSAFFFLPRQFHVTVVENSDEDHLRTAQWFVPLYLILINLFVIPIAMAGLLLGHAPQAADTFVLLLPLENGQSWLSLLVFLGGFSAAMGMVVICMMTVSTMVTNHLLLPVIDRFNSLGFLKQHLLRCRWAAVAVVLGIGYLFTTTVGDSYMLVNMGMLSFAAVLVLVPPILGGLFWSKGNKAGAFAGLAAGFSVWTYTLLVPALAKSGWIPESVVNEGPFGISLLRPEGLMGLSGIHHLTHAVLWILGIEIVAYISCSLLSRTSDTEAELREEFLGLLQTQQSDDVAIECDETIDLELKREILQRLLGQYLSEEDARKAATRSIRGAGIQEKPLITILELADLLKAAERILSGCIGSASAFESVRDSGLFSEQETKELSTAYHDALARMKVTPAELRRRVSIHQEREALLSAQAKDLEALVEQRTNQLQKTNSELRNEVETRRRTEREKERLNDRLVKASRKAGMAEVASNVLHNVGNILNSVNVSAGVLEQTARDFRVSRLAEVVDMLETKKDDLGTFLSEDDRGKLLPTYLSGLSKNMEEDRETFLGEISRLNGSIGHIIEVIRVQQDYARPWVVDEHLLVRDLLEDATRIACPTRSNGTFELHLEVPEDLTIDVDKHKVIQVLVNLVRNAKHSLREAYPNGGGEMTIRGTTREDEVVIEVEDNGVGIAKENLGLLFQYGFTTKEDGHGFGLHGSGNTARELGGWIEAHSDGPGQGALFTFFLPGATPPVKASAS